MVNFSSLAASLALLAPVLAQKIAFTSTPAVVVPGSAYNLTWGGGDNEGVSLTLRQGNPSYLDTVGIIASNILTQYYIWTVPSNLSVASNYALQIVQGLDDINYSGMFSCVSSANTTSVTVSPSVTISSNSSITAAPTSMGTGTAMPRNTTFSTGSLTSHSSSYVFGMTGSSTSATATSTSAPSSGGAEQVASNMALIFGVVAALFFN